jgi:hypothetical protein
VPQQSNLARRVQEAEESVTDGSWIPAMLQVIVAVVGIVVAAVWAKRISDREHSRQVVYQARQDVARMLNVLDDIYPAVEQAEFYETFSDTGPNDDDPVDMVKVQLVLETAHLELRNSTNLLQLTGPATIHVAAEAVRSAVWKFLNSVSGVVIEQDIYRDAPRSRLRDVPFGELKEKIASCERDLILKAQSVDRSSPWFGERLWSSSCSFVLTRWRRIRRRTSPAARGQQEMPTPVKG